MYFTISGKVHEINFPSVIWFNWIQWKQIDNTELRLCHNVFRKGGNRIGMGMVEEREKKNYDAALSYIQVHIINIYLFSLHLLIYLPHSILNSKSSKRQAIRVTFLFLVSQGTISWTCNPQKCFAWRQVLIHEWPCVTERQFQMFAQHIKVWSYKYWGWCKSTSAGQRLTGDMGWYIAEV